MPASSHGRTPRARLDPICSALDALSVFTALMTRPLRHETLVMFIDAGGCGRSLVTVGGTTDPFAVVEVAETMAMSAAGNPDISGIVLASVRPGDDARLNDDDDDDLWSDADAVVAELGLVLYDWLVIGRDGTISICDDLGLPPRWPSRSQGCQRK